MISTLLGLAAPTALACRDLDLYGFRADPPNRESALWVEGYDPEEIEVVRASDGALVPIEVHTLGVQALVFADWEPGVEYVPILDGAIFGTFVGGSSVQSAVAEPVLVRQRLWGDQEAPIPCTTTTHNESGVHFDFCDDAHFLVVAWGPDQPPFPELDDGLDWMILGHAGDLVMDSEKFWYEAAPGTSRTFWFGLVDARGEFGGWIRQDVELPGSGLARDDYLEDAGPPDRDGSGDEEWAECPGGDWVTGDPYTVPTVSDDPEDGDRGCATAPGPSWLGLFAGGLVALRRRRRPIHP